MVRAGLRHKPFQTRGRYFKRRPCWVGRSMLSSSALRSQSFGKLPLRVWIGKNKTPSWLGLENEAIFHHEIHLFECGDIRKRVATNRD